MASPGKSPENQSTAQRQETGEGSGAGGGNGSPRQEVPAAPPVTETIARNVVPPEGGGSSRRRERTEAFGSGSSSAAAAAERRQKRRSELVEVPSGPPVCYVCNKGFQSWKAVFGHMRTHKVGEERARTGAFPPPVFTPPGSPDREQEQQQALMQQQLAPTLLNIAQEVLLITRPAAGPPRNIDLNIAHDEDPSPPPPSAEAEPAAEPSSPLDGNKIDLNRPPKNDGDDDDDDGAN